LHGVVASYCILMFPDKFGKGTHTFYWRISYVIGDSPAKAEVERWHHDRSIRACFGAQKFKKDSG